MSFDDIPEDNEASYQCTACGGNITQNIISGVWECDSCDYKSGENNE